VARRRMPATRVYTYRELVNKSLQRAAPS